MFIVSFTCLVILVGLSLLFHACHAATSPAFKTSAKELLEKEIEQENYILQGDLLSLIKKEISISLNRSLELQETLKSYRMDEGALGQTNHPLNQENRQGWWTLEMTPDHAFDILRNNNSDESIIRIRKIDLDDNQIHTCYEYRNVLVTLTQLSTRNHTGTEDSNIVLRSGTFFILR